MRKLLIGLFLLFTFTSCVSENVTINPASTKELCPENAVKIWWAYMKQIEDDTTLLYNVAESCNEESECLQGIAEDFWKFSDTYIDKSGEPPECVALVHEMIRQNLHDEGLAFYEKSKGEYKKSNDILNGVLARMDEIDRLVFPILEGKFDVNHLTEIHNAEKTQTAIPEMELHNIEDFCVSANDAMQSFINNGFRDFTETKSNGLTKLELIELDKKSRGRIITLIFDGNCTYQIIVMTSMDRDLSEDEMRRNMEVLGVGSSIGAEEYGYTNTLVDIIYEQIPKLRQDARNDGTAKYEFTLIEGLEYPKAQIELRMYDEDYEALMYSIVFFP